ncbi:MAG TPA: alkaline phosphatase PhoX [Anaerolineales bacterium]
MKKALFVFVLVLALSSTTIAAGNPGFFTSQPAMLTSSVAGSSVLPILSVGDTLPNGYRFEAIPDGIGVTLNGQGTVDVFVNHETSLVPFPFTGNVATCTATTCFSDFDNAQVSRLNLHQNSAGVLSGELAIDSSANYQRFCSSFIAGAEHGFNHPIYFANEEATDFVSPPPLPAWPPNPSNQRQAGLVVALDTKNGKTYEIPGMGRHNHENTVVVPGGWDEIAALSGDDTFSAPASQMYMYTAASDDDLLADNGALWAFRATGKNGSPVNPADPFNEANDYGDFVAPSDWMTGEFIEVPRAIALGDQTPLENWSNENNVFQFIRVEDIAYDKNNPRIVYFADTGEPRAIPNPATGRLQRGPTGTTGPYMNGRIFKMVLNAADPKLVDNLTVLIDADAGGYNNPNVLHQPDNIDTSANGSLMIQEDPGSHNGQRTAFPNATNARVWRYDLGTGTFTVAAEVDQSLVPASPKGNWESSGIVDVSAIFGPGTWLVNVQAHSLFVESELRTVTVGTASGPITFKREGGQLLLLKIPGS